MNLIYMLLQQKRKKKQNRNERSIASKECRIKWRLIRGKLKKFNLNSARN